MLLPKCEGAYDDVEQYQLLIRVINEQTIKEGDNKRRLKTKEDGSMDSSIMQNSSELRHSV